MQKINEDTDIIFDDNPDVANNHLHVASKRSINELNKITDKDVEELLRKDLTENDEHWLWGPVKRIKRSFSSLWGDDSEETTQPEQETVPQSHQSQVDSLREYWNQRDANKKRLNDLFLQRQKNSNNRPGFDEFASNWNHELPNNRAHVVNTLYSVPHLDGSDRIWHHDDEDDLDENFVWGSGSHGGSPVATDSDFWKTPRQHCK